MDARLLSQVEDELAQEGGLVEESDYDNFTLDDAFDGEEEGLPEPMREPDSAQAASPKARRVSAFGTWT